MAKQRRQKTTPRRAAKPKPQRPPTSLTNQQLHAALKSLRRELDQKMRQQWQRSLPLDELLSDRWERATSLGFAAGASIYSNSLVFGEVKVGKKTWVGPYTLLDGSAGKIQVGAFCNLSAGVQLYTHDTIHWCLSGGTAKTRHGDISIGDCTYIGPNTLVQHGVSIGDHCVIGANSLVNRSIPAYSFAAGNPCRVIGRVTRQADGEFTFTKYAS